MIEVIVLRRSGEKKELSAEKEKLLSEEVSRIAEAWSVCLNFEKEFDQFSVTLVAKHFVDRHMNRAGIFLSSGLLFSKYRDKRPVSVEISISPLGYAISQVIKIREFLENRNALIQKILVKGGKRRAKNLVDVLDLQYHGLDVPFDDLEKLNTGENGLYARYHPTMYALELNSVWERYCKLTSVGDGVKELIKSTVKMCEDAASLDSFGKDKDEIIVAKQVITCLEGIVEGVEAISPDSSKNVFLGSEKNNAATLKELLDHLNDVKSRLNMSAIAGLGAELPAGSGNNTAFVALSEKTTVEQVDQRRKAKAIGDLTKAWERFKVASKKALGHSICSPITEDLISKEREKVTGEDTSSIANIIKSLNDVAANLEKKSSSCSSDFLAALEEFRGAIYRSTLYRTSGEVEVESYLRGMAEWWEDYSVTSASTAPDADTPVGTEAIAVISLTLFNLIKSEFFILNDAYNKLVELYALSGEGASKVLENTSIFFAKFPFTTRHPDDSDLIRYNDFFASASITEQIKCVSPAMESHLRRCIDAIHYHDGRLQCTEEVKKLFAAQTTSINSLINVKKAQRICASVRPVLALLDAGFKKQEIIQKFQNDLAELAEKRKASVITELTIDNSWLQLLAKECRTELLPTVNVATVLTNIKGYINENTDLDDSILEIAKTAEQGQATQLRNNLAVVLQGIREEYENQIPGAPELERRREWWLGKIEEEIDSSKETLSRFLAPEKLPGAFQSDLIRLHKNCQAIVQECKAYIAEVKRQADAAAEKRKADELAVARRNIITRLNLTLNSLGEDLAKRITIEETLLAVSRYIPPLLGISSQLVLSSLDPKKPYNATDAIFEVMWVTNLKAHVSNDSLITSISTDTLNQAAEQIEMHAEDRKRDLLAGLNAVLQKIQEDYIGKINTLKETAPGYANTEPEQEINLLISKVKVDADTLLNGSTDQFKEKLDKLKQDCAKVINLATSNIDHWKEEKAQEAKAAEEREAAELEAARQAASGAIGVLEEHRVKKTIIRKFSPASDFLAEEPSLWPVYENNQIFNFTPEELKKISTHEGDSSAFEAAMPIIIGDSNNYGIKLGFGKEELVQLAKKLNGEITNREDNLRAELMAALQAIKNKYNRDADEIPGASDYYSTLEKEKTPHAAIASLINSQKIADLLNQSPSKLETTLTDLKRDCATVIETARGAVDKWKEEKAEREAGELATKRFEVIDRLNLALNSLEEDLAKQAVIQTIVVSEPTSWLQPLADALGVDSSTTDNIEALQKLRQKISDSSISIETLNQAEQAIVKPELRRENLRAELKPALLAIQNEYAVQIPEAPGYYSAPNTTPKDEIASLTKDEQIDSLLLSTDLEKTLEDLKTTCAGVVSAAKDGIDKWERAGEKLLALNKACRRLLTILHPRVSHLLPELPASLSARNDAIRDRENCVQTFNNYVWIQREDIANLRIKRQKNTELRGKLQANKITLPPLPATDTPTPVLDAVLSNNTDTLITLTDEEFAAFPDHLAAAITKADQYESALTGALVKKKESLRTEIDGLKTVLGATIASVTDDSQKSNFQTRFTAITTPDDATLAALKAIKDQYVELESQVTTAIDASTALGQQVEELRTAWTATQQKIDGFIATYNTKQVEIDSLFSAVKDPKKLSLTNKSLQIEFTQQLTIQQSIATTLTKTFSTEGALREANQNVITDAEKAEQSFNGIKKRLGGTTGLLARQQELLYALRRLQDDEDKAAKTAQDKQQKEALESAKKQAEEALNRFDKLIGLRKLLSKDLLPGNVPYIDVNNDVSLPNQLAKARGNKLHLKTAADFSAFAETWNNYLAREETAFYDQLSAQVTDIHGSYLKKAKPEKKITGLLKDLNLDPSGSGSFLNFLNTEITTGRVTKEKLTIAGKCNLLINLLIAYDAAGVVATKLIAAADESFSSSSSTTTSAPELEIIDSTTTTTSSGSNSNTNNLRDDSSGIERSEKADNRGDNFLFGSNFEEVEERGGSLDSTFVASSGGKGFSELLPEFLDVPTEEDSRICFREFREFREDESEGEEPKFKAKGDAEILEKLFSSPPGNGELPEFPSMVVVRPSKTDLERFKQLVRQLDVGDEEVMKAAEKAKSFSLEHFKIVETKILACINEVVRPRKEKIQRIDALRREINHKGKALSENSFVDKKALREIYNNFKSLKDKELDQELNQLPTVFLDLERLAFIAIVREPGQGILGWTEERAQKIIKQAEEKNLEELQRAVKNITETACEKLQQQIREIKIPKSLKEQTTYAQITDQFNSALAEPDLNKRLSLLQKVLQQVIEWKKQAVATSAPQRVDNSIGDIAASVDSDSNNTSKQQRAGEPSGSAAPAPTKAALFGPFNEETTLLLNLIQQMGLERKVAQQLTKAAKSANTPQELKRIRDSLLKAVKGEIEAGFVSETSDDSLKVEELAKKSILKQEINGMLKSVLPLLSEMQKKRLEQEIKKAEGENSVEQWQYVLNNLKYISECHKKQSSFLGNYLLPNEQGLLREFQKKLLDEYLQLIEKIEQVEQYQNKKIIQQLPYISGMMYLLREENIQNKRVLDGQDKSQKEQVSTTNLYDGMIELHKKYVASLNEIESQYKHSGLGTSWRHKFLAFLGLVNKEHTEKVEFDTAKQFLKTQIKPLQNKIKLFEKVQQSASIDNEAIAGVHKKIVTLQQEIDFVEGRDYMLGKQAGILYQAGLTRSEAEKQLNKAPEDVTVKQAVTDAQKACTAVEVAVKSATEAIAEAKKHLDEPHVLGSFSQAQQQVEQATTAVTTAKKQLKIVIEKAQDAETAVSVASKAMNTAGQSAQEKKATPVLSRGGFMANDSLKALGKKVAAGHKAGSSDENQGKKPSFF